MKRSAVILTQARLLVVDRERLAMTTIFSFFKRLIHHNEICPVSDAVLRDIGSSRVFVLFL
jgi:hypothetical protein